MSKLIDKYTYRVEWDNDDKIHIANCLESVALAIAIDFINRFAIGSPICRTIGCITS